MELSELRVYNQAMNFGERIWDLTSRWNDFAKDTVGKQLVRSADSVAANISEGFGRYHYKDNKRFCYFARGSLNESITWIHKALKRGLIDDSLRIELETETTILGKMLNRYISSIGPRDNI